MSFSPGFLRPVNLKPCVFFDIDGTWLRWQLFDEWIQKCVELGILPAIVLAMAEKERRAYKLREAPFVDFMNALVDAYCGDRRLAGMRVSDARFAAKAVMEEKGRMVHVFTSRLARAAEDCGKERVIISGSPREAVAAFAEYFGIKLFLGTEHSYEKGVFTGKEHLVWANQKGKAIKKLAAENELDLSRSVGIGDSASDAEMLKLMQYPICFNPEQGLLAQARASRWPVVWEKKDVFTFYRSDAEGKLHEVSISDILPQDLAKALQAA
ncbi:MAG: HAD-IB family hydrolase [Patescibacteria group bacterium]|nr:HAD-IB family hydrolase [Patescibacteria group bacterium]MBU1034414.1 HAD-IB family hydrolase [Patescibacteria group bacterium]